jgi:hypothetical protein
MALAKAARENLVLAIGLTLPILLLLGFLVAGSVSRQLAGSPQYSIVFAIAEYGGSAQTLPVTPRLVVKSGVLKVQYTKPVRQPNGYQQGGWKKLYLYDAASRRVRDLGLELPANPESIEGMREETVEATKDLTLDTTLESPDGYILTFGGSSRGGLLGDLFWHSYDQYGPRLTKGGSSVRLMPQDSPAGFSGGPVEFVGWVTGTTR